MLKWLQLIRTLGPILGPKLQTILPMIIDLINSIVSNIPSAKLQTAKPSDSEFQDCVDECKKHGCDDKAAKELCSQMPVA